MLYHVYICRMHIFGGKLEVDNKIFLGFMLCPTPISSPSMNWLLYKSSQTSDHNRCCMWYFSNIVRLVLQLACCRPRNIGVVKYSWISASEQMCGGNNIFFSVAIYMT